MHSRSLRPFLFAASVVATLALASSLHAQSKRKSPTSKFFVADLNGEAQVDTGDRIDDLENFYVAHVDDERSVLFEKQRLKLRKLLHEVRVAAALCSRVLL